MTKHRVAVAMAIAAAIALFGSACSDDADSGTSAQQADVDALTARLQRNEMMFAVQTISTLGLHDMDEQLNDTGEVGSRFAPNTRTAVRLFALTDWDASLQEDAESLEAIAVGLLQALEAEDIDAAADAAARLHDREHDFSNEVWAILAADLPPDAGGVEAHDEEAATPEAGVTPETGDEPEASPAAEATP